VGITNLQRADYPHQPSLFAQEEKKTQAASVIDRIWKKFGPQAIQRATLLEKK